MYTIIFVLIVIGAALALVAAAIALRGYLRLRRTRAAVQAPLTEEVERLAARTNELEEGLSALDARAQQLPIQIQELQQSLATLQVLTGAWPSRFARPRPSSPSARSRS